MNDEADAVAIRACEVWGLPLARITYGEALARIVGLVEARRPSYVVTANLNYAMLSRTTPGLDAVTRGAAFVVCDGVPLVWVTRLRGEPVPEPIAGSDLIFDLCGESARRGYRVFFMGGAPGVAEEAAARLAAANPGLRVAGTLSPPFRPLGPDDEAEIAAAVRAARPDVLFVAMNQPQGDLFLARNLGAWGVPFCLQVGRSFDLAAGRARRAPRWMRRGGVEMVHRVALEPRRLAGRYARNLAFLIKMLTRDALRGRS